jgi:hypothetical protein
VKIVMTMLVRDEVDVIDSQLAFHVNAGVDFFVVMDHGSTDGTTEILERYERSGRLHLIRQDSELLLHGEWVTDMARLAASELGADWVLASDADEFWWPSGGELEEVLASVPKRYGVVTGMWRDFPFRAGDALFAERMTARLSLGGPLNDETGPYHVNMKVAFRGDRNVELQGGQHGVRRHFGPRLREWYPLEVLHFPIRSRAQAERKFAAADAGRAKAIDAGRLGSEPSKHRAAAYGAIRAGGFDEWLARWTLDDEALARGLDEGWLYEDTRVRDVLRLLCDGGDATRAFRMPPGRDAAYIDDACRLAEADAIVRTAGRMDGLERRIASLEADLAAPRVWPRAARVRA